MPVQDKTATVAGENAKEGRKSDRHMLIDGQLVDADQTYPSVNPANGEVVGYAPNAGVADAERAIAAARRAFDTTDWSTNVELRIRCMDQLHKALVEHSDELRALTIAEVGATQALTEGPQLDDPDQDHRLLRRAAEDLSADRGTRRDREPRTAPPPLGREGSRRRRRGDHRLQLSQPAGDGQAGSGAGRRLHGRAEGRPRYPADHAGPRRDRRQVHRHPGRRDQRDQLHRRRGRRGPDDESRRRRRDVHRIDGHRPQDHGRRRARPSRRCSWNWAASRR